MRLWQAFRGAQIPPLQGITPGVAQGIPPFQPKDDSSPSRLGNVMGQDQSAPWQIPQAPKRQPIGDPVGTLQEHLASTKGKQCPLPPFQVCLGLPAPPPPGSP